MKKYFSVLLSLVLIMQMLTTGLFVPNVHAENGDEEVVDDNAEVSEDTESETSEETESEGSDTFKIENMYAKLSESDPTRLTDMMEGLEYNPQVQFLMTYTILKNNYFDNRAYSEFMYNGQIDADVKSKVNTDVQFGVQSLLSNGSTTVDNPHATGTETAYQTAVTDIKKANEELTELILPFFIQQYIARYFIRDNVLGDNTDSKYLYRNDSGYNIGEYNSTENPILVAHLIDYKIDNVVGNSESAIQNRYSKDKGLFNETGKYKYIYKLLKQKINGALNDAETENDVLNILKKQNFIDVGLDTNKTSDANGETQRVNGVTNMKEMFLEVRKENGFWGGYTVVGNTYAFEFAKKKTETYAQEYVKLLQINKDVIISEDYAEYLADLSNSFSGYANNYYEKKIKSSKELQNFLSAKQKSEPIIAETRQGELGLIGWLPLSLVATDTAKSDEDYNKLIEAFDEGKVDTANNSVKTVTSAGYLSGDRALQINDLFNLKMERVEENWSSKHQKSASPYLVKGYETNAPKLMEVKYGNKVLADTQHTFNPARYAGMKLNQLEGGSIWDLSAWAKKFSGKSGKNITEPLTVENILASNLDYGEAVVAYTSSLGKEASGNVTDTSDYTIGIDTYGNIISGSNLGVVVPYWQNHTIMRKDGTDLMTSSQSFVSSPAIKTFSSSAELQNIVNSKIKGNFQALEVTTANLNLTNIAGDLGIGNVTDIMSPLNNMKNLSSSSTPYSLILEAQSSNEGLIALALAITNGTRKNVELHNKEMVKVIKDTQEVYLQPSDGNFNHSSVTDGDSLDEFNARDFLEKVQFLLDYGFYELIRLTIASWVVSFYTSSFVNFTLSNIFYTELITESSTWGSIVDALSQALIGIMFVYLIFMGFRLFKGTLTGGNFVKQFLALTLSIMIPLVFYAPIINLVLNEPVRWVIGTQMQQQSILDAYLMADKDAREEDDIYKMLFGSVDETRDRTEDYLMSIYTNTHVDGFDVRNYTTEDVTGTSLFRTEEYIKEHGWKPNEVISYNISIFHLFEWVENQEEHGQTLFEFLAKNYAEQYAGISEHTEYEYDTKTLYPQLGVNIPGQKWTASSLYLKIYTENNNENTIESIKNLAEVARIFREGEKSANDLVITEKDKDSFVRDLALSAETRKQIFGGDGTLLSPSSEMIKAEFNILGLNPTTDVFNLSTIVSEVIPYRDITTETTEHRDVYEITKNVLDTYIVDYSIVRDVVGDNNTYSLSEYRMILLEIWMNLNEELKIPMFPYNYEVTTITSDTYMRMGFIPLSAFTDNTDKTLDNVSKYLALREHPMSLLFGFLPMLLMLWIFGFIYLVMFYGVMVIIVTASFVYNYVIKANYNNKMALGAITIILGFGVAKFGLLILWRLMSYAMNYRASINGGSPDYPYMIAHCILIIVYLFFVLKYIVGSILKKVIDDKANLGGELFANSFGQMMSKIKGGNLSLKTTSGTNMGNNVRKLKEMEGTAGRIAGAGVAFGAGALSSMLAKNQDKLGNTKQDVNEIREGLENYKNMSDGEHFAERFSGTFKGAEKRELKKLAKDYDNLDVVNTMLSKEEQELNEKNKEFGKIISAHDSERLTTLDVGSEANAKKLAEHLMSNGIKAVSDGGSVIFNSTGYDLENSGVRKYLFGEMLTKELSETYHQNKVTDLFNDKLQEYSVAEDGTVFVNVGDSAISGKSLDNLVNSSLMKNNYSVVSLPQKNRNGEYISGFMQLKPVSSRVDVTETMEDLFLSDEHERKNKRHGVRKSSNLNHEVTFDEKSETSLVRKYLADGMYIQEGKVLYNEKDKTHVKQAEIIKEELLRSRDSQQVESAELMKSIASNVVLGGDAGFRVATASVSDDLTARDLGNSHGLLSSMVTTKVFGGSKSAKIVDTINNVNSILTSDSDTLNNYSSNREDLRLYGEKILSNLYSPQEFTNLINNKLMESTNAEVKQASKGFSQELKKVTNDYKSAKITEAEYNREMEKITSHVQILAMDTGVYDNHLEDLLTKESEKLKKEKKDPKQVKVIDDLTKSYKKSKADLEGSGFDTRLIHHLSEDDLSRLGGLVTNINEVSANTDGTINISTTNGLDGESTTKLMTEVQKIIEKLDENSQPKYD